MKTTLSSLPSEAVEQLLNDLELIENTPGFSIDMTTWGDTGWDSGTCTVCLGGAHLAGIMGIKGTRDMLLRDDSAFDYTDVEGHNAARAGDSLRKGRVKEFLEFIGAKLELRRRAIENPTYPPIDWVKYEDSPVKFKEQLVGLVLMFEQLEEILEIAA